MPPFPATHELEEGTRIADQFGHFGTRGIDEPTDPAYQFCEIIGEGGSGKTSLFRDHPGAFVHNFDCNPVPRPSRDATPSKAQFFPCKDGRGRLLGANGHQIPEAPWSAHLAAQTAIISAVKSGAPHPQTIVIDSMASAILPMMNFVMETRPRFKKYGTLEEVPDGDPIRALYGTAYNSLAAFMADYLAVGLGVYVIGHRIQKTVKEIVTTNNIPEALRSRYYTHLNMLLEVQVLREPYRDPTTQQARFRLKRFLTLPPDDSREQYRSRIDLPLPWEIPAVGAWPAFRQLCLDAGATSSLDNAIPEPIAASTIAVAVG